MTWDYIAGFFDGEGSITWNGKGYRISIAQTNKEVFDKMIGAIGIGLIFKVKKRQAHWKEAWVFYIAKQEHVLLFLQECYPHLIVKKTLAHRAMKKLRKSIDMAKARKNLREKRIEQAVLLRDRGYTYREMGKSMNIDFGYARQLFLVGKLIK